MLTALRAEGEIGLHVRAALRNGLTADEIAEVLLQAAVYAGVPAANAAFAIAGRVLAEGDAPADRSSPDAPPGAGPTRRARPRRDAISPTSSDTPPTARKERPR